MNSLYVNNPQKKKKEILLPECALEWGCHPARTLLCDQELPWVSPKEREASAVTKGFETAGAISLSICLGYLERKSFLS